MILDFAQRLHLHQMVHLSGEKNFQSHHVQKISGVPLRWCNNTYFIRFLVTHGNARHVHNLSLHKINKH
jgi:hypothetical protein